MSAVQHIKPLGNRVLAKRLEQEQTLKGGIILPDSAKKKQETAVIIAVGTNSTASGPSRRPQRPLPTTGLVATSGILSVPGALPGRQPTPMVRGMRSKQSAARCESRTPSSHVRRCYCSRARYHI